MPRILLATSPADDTATQYLDVWTQKVIALARKQPDTEIFELCGSQANREEFTRLVQEHKPQLIILNGHGSKNLITGFNKEILVACDDNETLLKDTITHALSCDTGQELGPRAITIGTRSFIGYTELFQFYHLNRQTKEEQRQDAVAGFFLDPAYEVIIALIEGNDAQTAYERSQKMHKATLESLLTSKNTNYNTGLASSVYHNLTHQVCLGDPKASF
jgi:hypothetical protein